jgi:hypothetical protein
MKTICIKWSSVDVLTRAEDLGIEITEEQADKILDDMERQHDANYGITWETIDSHLYDLNNN